MIDLHLLFGMCFVPVFGFVFKKWCVMWQNSIFRSSNCSFFRNWKNTLFSIPVFLFCVKLRWYLAVRKLLAAVLVLYFIDGDCTPLSIKHQQKKFFECARFFKTSIQQFIYKNSCLTRVHFLILYSISKIEFWKIAIKQITDYWKKKLPKLIFYIQVSFFLNKK